MTTHLQRRKQLRDYPEIAGHEAPIIAALLEWLPVGAPMPTRENIGSFTMQQAKIALRCVLWARDVKPEAKERARDALHVLKSVQPPRWSGYGWPNAKRS